MGGFSNVLWRWGVRENPDGREKEKEYGWTEGVGMRDRIQERQNKETWEAKKGG